MQIDDKLIDYLEELSCLALTVDEKQRIAHNLKDVLGYMERLGELDMGEIPERSHPFDNVNAFREDIVGASFDRELILKNAPARDSRMFIAPKTIE